MSVDKFGRNGDRTTTVCTGINIANLTNSFLRDGGNTVIGAIDKNNNIIKNVADPLSNEDVASKNPLSNQDVASNNYVDTNAFTTAVGVVSGDIKLNVGSDLARSLGCKKFTFLLGTDINMLSYSLPDSGLPVPVKIKSYGCFTILIYQLPIYDFSQDVILCSQPINMD